MPNTTSKYIELTKYLLRIVHLILSHRITFMSNYSTSNSIFRGFYTKCFPTNSLNVATYIFTYEVFNLYDVGRAIRKLKND